jgi:FMN phosphatase YigB (HAD superfamily)
MIPMPQEQRSIQWIVFDFGGTLAHSIPSFPGFVARHLSNFGLTRSVDEVEGVIERMQSEAWMREVRHDSDEEDRVFWSRFYERVNVLLDVPGGLSHIVSAMMREHYAIDSFRLYPDVLPALTKLHSHQLSIAVASNFDSSLRTRLSFLGLAPLVQLAIISAEIGVSKPAQGFYIRLLNELNVSPRQLLCVGNSMRDDIEPAIALGIRSVLIDRVCNEPMGVGRIGSLQDLDVIFGDGASGTSM